MTHEPDCYLSHDKTEDGCSICDAVVAAYQRGREDAAKAVWALDRYSNSKISDDWFCKIDDAVIAAIEGKPSTHLQEPDALERWQESLDRARGGEQE